MTDILLSLILLVSILDLVAHTRTGKNIAVKWDEWRRRKAR